MHIHVIGERNANTDQFTAVLQFLGITAEVSIEPAAGGDVSAVVLAAPYRAVSLPVSTSMPILLLGAPNGHVPGVDALATIDLPLRQGNLYAALRMLRVYHHQLLQAAPAPSPEQCAVLAEIPGEHVVLNGLRSAIFDAAMQDAPTLVSGETGTGKRRIAGMIHRCSPRAEKPFIPVSCATFPETMVAAELFGCEQGAMPGALQRRIGRLELADGGTLVLEDVESLSIASQASLLGYLRSLRLERVGSVRSVPCDTRIMATTAVDLAELVTRGEFREDLFYAIRSQSVQVPPLRSYVECLADVMFADGAARCAVALDGSAWDRLRAHDWPGNLLELHNLRRALTGARGSAPLSAEQLPPFVARLDTPPPVNAPTNQVAMDGEQLLLPVNGINLKEYLANLEQSLIVQALEDTGSVVARAADRLHIRRTTLVEKMRKYGLQRG